MVRFCKNSVLEHLCDVKNSLIKKYNFDLTNNSTQLIGDLDTIEAQCCYGSMRFYNDLIEQVTAGRLILHQTKHREIKSFFALRGLKKSGKRDIFYLIDEPLPLPPGPIISERLTSFPIPRNFKTPVDSSEFLQQIDVVSAKFNKINFSHFLDLHISNTQQKFEFDLRRGASQLQGDRLGSLDAHIAYVTLRSCQMITDFFDL